MIQKIFNSILIIAITTSLSYSQHTSTESVLNTGTWQKVCVSSDGVYKMNQTFFTDMGFDVATLDPKHIKVYGSGGGMLAQSNDEFRYDDLFENSIYVKGEGDGSFDASDYVLFHGEGAHVHNLKATGITHQVNYYSTKSCYFVTVDDDSQGKRILTETIESVSDTIYTSFDEYKWLEKEEHNVLESGREWFGQSHRGGSTSDQSISTPSKVTGTNYEVTIDVMTMSVVTPTQFNVSINSNSLAPIACTASPDVDYGVKGKNNTNVYDFASTASNVQLELYYDDKGKTDAKGYLDYFSVAYKRNLSFSSQLFFQVLESGSTPLNTYKVAGGTASSQVWDVSDGETPRSLTYDLNGSNVSFSDSSNAKIKRYVVFNSTSLSAPTYVGGVANQNLHGITQSPNLLIVAHANFMTQAEELAAHRRTFNGYTVEVVDIKDIYNEFSSGVQDVSSIRDFAKMLYDRNEGENALRYLLLFGDASYDYLDRESNNSNYIPIYEAKESLNDIRTFSSDDYHGFLDDDEGAWIESSSGNHLLDIGVGRIVAKTTNHADIVVEKLISYDLLENSGGKWRNKICFVADDGDSYLHMDDADDLSVSIGISDPQYLFKKVYTDSYEQISSSSGELAPDVNTAINEQIDKGVLIVNYTGHGGEGGWAQEQILTLNMIDEFDNMANLPFFMTATCEFGRYDDPKRSSGAEYLLLKEQGGAIGLVTTTRPVYATNNYLLASAFYEHVFTPNADNTMPVLGDVIRLTKNNSVSDVYNRNFSLLGDPSMALAYPENKVEVTMFNETDVNIVSTDTVGALEIVSVAGIVSNPLTGDTLKSFNGVLYATVLDKPTQVISFGYDDGDGYHYKTQESVLFDGKATVTDGMFQFEFVLPKDIDYTLGNGKISFYAIADDYTTDANGVYTDFVVGGSSNNIVLDETPPTVQMYLNDTTFRNHGLVAEDALFIAHVFDENGINTSNSGIGHEITLMIDGNSQGIILLNEFYEATRNTYKGGVVSYSLSDLPEGEHFLVFRVWDTYNNSTTDTLYFEIGDLVGLSIRNNPFDDFTDIDILQQRAGEPLEVNAEIFNVSGQIIWANKYSYEAAPSTIEDISWNGESRVSNELPSGIYIIRLVLRYPSDGTTLVKSSKLVLID